MLQPNRRQCVASTSRRTCYSDVRCRSRTSRMDGQAAICRVARCMCRAIVRVTVLPFGAESAWFSWQELAALCASATFGISSLRCERRASLGMHFALRHRLSNASVCAWGIKSIQAPPSGERHSTKNKAKEINERRTWRTKSSSPHSAATHRQHLRPASQENAQGQSTAMNIAL